MLDDVPDVIVCYESNAPFLTELFPRALFLHSTLGIFSRPPFPETSALDPFGVGKDSYLARCELSQWDRSLSSAERGRIARLKYAFQRVQVESSPVERARCAVASSVSSCCPFRFRGTSCSMRTCRPS